MKKTISLAALALPLMALPAMAQSFDFSLLDKLGANSKEKTDITLDANMMKLASGVLGDDKEAESVKKLAANLNGMVIRSYKFSEDRQYNQTDLDPFRAYLKQSKWTRIVDNVESGEHSEIYVRPQDGGKLGGFAIVAAERREVTVVYIDGAMNLDDLGKLSSIAKIPSIKLEHAAPKTKKEE